ncbi:MAG: magnesium transporter, partial [Phycisphaeraceae bacterium]
LRELLFADPDDKVETLMDGQTASLHAADDREVAVHTMERYDMPALPVVDRDDLLVGIVTFDDVADVAEEEATEDFHKLGGVEALDQPYLSTSTATLVRKRVGWLAILFGAGLLTVSAMGAFEKHIDALPLLAVFVPLIIATGGNSGFQAATLMTRAIALREVEPRHFGRVFQREMLGGLMLGLILSAFGFVMATGVGMWMYSGEEAIFLRSAHVGLAVGTSILAVVLFGNMAGSMLPFLLLRMGMDPATGSTPFVATIVDVAGLLIYFTIATLILGI